MGDRTWLSNLRLRSASGSADQHDATRPGTGGGTLTGAGDTPLLRAVQPGDILAPAPRPEPMSRCRTTATHLRVDDVHGHVAVHVRPDARAWRPAAPDATTDALAELRYAHSDTPGTVGPGQSPMLTVAAYPRATSLVERQRRLGLPAGPAAVVQGDRLAYNGLGPCTRVLRFSGGPDRLGGELAGSLHLLWRVGPSLDLLLTVVAPRAEQLFAVLPDVDSLADALELCVSEARHGATAPAWPASVPPRSAFAT